MFVLSLVFLALLATSAGQSGIPRYIQGQWSLTDENLEYEDTDGRSLTVEERIWPDSSPEVAAPVAVEDQTMPTTPEPHLMKEQASNEAEESAVWKIVLVAAVLLVSVVGSVSTAYYLCVWRGGRIHYQAQKGGYA